MVCSYSNRDQNQGVRNDDATPDYVTQINPFSSIRTIPSASELHRIC